MKRPLLYLAPGLIILLIIFAHSSIPQDKTKWIAPEKYKRMENPIELDSEVLSIGKSDYSKYCKTCHGKDGKGGGAKAQALIPPVPDLTSDLVLSQTDGELFYKITTGRNAMVNYSKIIEVEDIWMLVHYIRSIE